MKLITTVFTLLAIGSAAQAAIQIDGFGSLYYGQASGDILAQGFSHKQPQFAPFSLVGLNLYSKLDNDFSVGAQLIAQGASYNLTAPTATGLVTSPVGVPTGDIATVPLPDERQFIMSAEWAFLNWSPSSDFSAKMGRILNPAWIASDYLSVGALLPYRQVPRDVYGLSPFSSFDGGQINKSFDVGVGRLTTSAWGGTPVLIAGTLQITNYWGVSLGLDGEGWGVKLTQSSAILRLPALNAGSLLNTSSASFKIDKNNFVMWGEAFYTKANKDSDTIAALGGVTLVEQTDGGYVLVGYKIGKFLPRYTYTKTHSNVGVAAESKGQTHTVGLNYDIASQAVFKLDYQMIKAEDNFAMPAGTRLKGPTDNNGSAIYAGFDFTF